MSAYASYATWVLLRAEAKPHGGQIIEFIENFGNFGNFDNFEYFVKPIEQSLREQTTKREVYSKLTLQPVRAVNNE